MFRKLTEEEWQAKCNKTRLTHITRVCSSREELIAKEDVCEHQYRDDLYKDVRCRPNGRTLTLVAGFNSKVYQWNLHDGWYDEFIFTFSPKLEHLAEIKAAYDVGDFDRADDLAKRYSYEYDRDANLNYRAGVLAY